LPAQKLYYSADIDTTAFPKLKAHVQYLIQEARIIDGWWNMVYIDKVMSQLRKESYEISDDGLKSVD